MPLLDPKNGWKMILLTIFSIVDGRADRGGVRGYLVAPDCTAQCFSIPDSNLTKDLEALIIFKILQ